MSDWNASTWKSNISFNVFFERVLNDRRCLPECRAALLWYCGSSILLDTGLDFAIFSLYCASAGDQRRRIALERSPFHRLSSRENAAVHLSTCPHGLTVWYPLTRADRIVPLAGCGSSGSGLLVRRPANGVGVRAAIVVIAAPGLIEILVLAEPTYRGVFVIRPSMIGPSRIYDKEIRTLASASMLCVRITALERNGRADFLARQTLRHSAVVLLTLVR